MTRIKFDLKPGIADQQQIVTTVCHFLYLKLVIAPRLRSTVKCVIKMSRYLLKFNEWSEYTRELESHSRSKGKDAFYYDQVLGQ